LNAIAVIVSVAMALAVALFGEDRRVKPWFVATCISCAALSAALWIELNVPDWSFLAARVNMTAALALAASGLMSTRAMSSLPASRPVVMLLACAAVLNLATVWATDLYFSGAVLRYPWGTYVAANPRFVANPMVVAAIAGYAVVLVAGAYRTAHALEKNRAKYMFAAFTCLSLSVLDYLPHFGITPFGAPVGVVFITLFLFLFGYACLRYRLVVFREFVGRAAGWVLAFGAVALAYALAVEAARRGGAAGGGAYLAGTMAAAAVYALLGRAVPAWTQRLLGAREPDYPRAIRDYSDTITSIFDEEAVRASTASACAHIFGAVHAVFVEGEELEVLGVRAYLSTGADSVVELEVLRRTHALSSARPYELFLPVHRHGELVGALAVGRRSDGRMYSPHALESLRTLANVLGMAIANARGAKELAARVALLESKNREIGVLNDELRRQVTDRSRQLAAALQRIGAVPAREHRLEPGQTIDDRYVVVRELGSGGMGTVYEVTRTSDGRHLAMKIMTTAQSGDALARLAREAEIAGKMSHPNLVSIVDVDVSRAGALYIVMELVEGQPLREARSRRGDVPWVLAVLRQIATGLAALHGGGIIHRDLKPANVLLTGDEGAPIAKIADFGIARLAENDLRTALAATRDLRGDTDPPAPTITASYGELQTPETAPLTHPGQILGTPRYMAPELASGAKDAQPSSDIWSFGILALELLVGALPFASPTAGERRAARMRAEEDLGRLPGLPASIAKLLARTLAFTPAERPTATELASALAQDLEAVGDQLAPSASISR
jgi:serine/threonine-protein kinase